MAKSILPPMQMYVITLPAVVLPSCSIVAPLGAAGIVDPAQSVDSV